MSVVSTKYQKLLPTLDYLSDPVVLAQAWKKTHTYIRSHNWYADTLELDASAFNLEKDLERLSNDLRTGTYQPEPMRLVPAPKSQDWTFVKDENEKSWSWEPKLKPDEEWPKELRPLAQS